MDTRTAYRVFMKHQLEFGIEEGIITNITVNDIDNVIAEFEDDPHFHEQMAGFLEDVLD